MIAERTSSHMRAAKPTNESATSQARPSLCAAPGSEVERLKSELEGLTRRYEARGRIIRELIEANEKIVASAPLTDAQRGELARYVAQYLDRGVRGVWYDLATGIAALMAENERLANLPNNAICVKPKDGK